MFLLIWNQNNFTSMWKWWSLSWKCWITCDEKAKRCFMPMAKVSIFRWSLFWLVPKKFADIFLHFFVGVHLKMHSTIKNSIQNVHLKQILQTNRRAWWRRKKCRNLQHPHNMSSFKFRNVFDLYFYVIFMLCQGISRFRSLEKWPGQQGNTQNTQWNRKIAE